MHVKELVPKVKGLAVKAGGFIRRRKRLTIAVVVAALLFGPLLTTDGELVFLNAVGLGLGALLLRRFIRPGGRQRTGRAQQAQRQRTAKATGNMKEDMMTTQATTIGGIGTRPRQSLEELVDRLMAALFRAEPETAPQAETPSMARSVHEARRLRQAGDLDGALAVLGGVDTARAETREARWAFAEWLDLAKRRFGDRETLVYSQGAGRAAALGSTNDGGTLGGRGGPGDALAARQGRLPAQPAGAAALGEGLPSALTGEWPGAVVAQATVDDS